jgi:predicted metalloprotease with PDZ domain
MPGNSKYHLLQQISEIYILQAISKGIFVSLVQSGSPAALVGLRFGDQILQINGTSVAGWSMDKIHDAFKKADVNNIRVAVRDRYLHSLSRKNHDDIYQVPGAFSGLLNEPSRCTRTASVTLDLLLKTVLSSVW